MSITQVAKVAKVPYATAWRIINNQACTSEESVKAVQAAMQHLGYTPGQAKRGRPPRSAEGIRTHNVALLHLRDGTAVSTSILSGVQGMLAKLNLNLIFAHMNDSGELPQAVKAGKVDGILGYGEFPSHAITPALRRIPAVWLMSRSADGSDVWGDRIKPDHPRIGNLAAEYLLARRHTNVAYFNPRPGTAVYDDRGESFKRAAEKHEQPVTVIQGSAGFNGPGWMDAAAEAFVKHWLPLPVRPTGVFCPVDRLTLRVYSHLMRAGVQPGRDVEFVSCDNETELLSLIHPAPASIELNRSTMARLAVERLLWRMRHGMSSPSVTTTVSPTLDLNDITPWTPGVPGASAR